MFRKEELGKNLYDMSLYEFLQTEPIIKEVPEDYYKETEFAGENNIITIRLPKQNVKTIHDVWSWARKNGLIVPGTSSSMLLRKIFKHGAILMTNDKLFKEALKLDEKRLKFMDTILTKQSPYYNPKYSTMFSVMLEKYEIILEQLQMLFKRSKNQKINFRAQPRWMSVLTSLSYALGSSSYQMYRIAFIYSLSTIGREEPSLDEIREIIEQTLEVQRQDIKLLEEIYKNETGEKL